MDNRPIGIFDSGFGGLTSAFRVLERQKGESIVYFGDTARMPYGGRSRQELSVMLRQNVEFLRRFDVKIVLAACGTISSTVLPQLADSLGVPAVGVLLPAVEQALETTKNNRVAVIATEVTINGGAFGRELIARQPELWVCQVACPKIVPLIEAGRTDENDPELQSALEEYLEPVVRSGADTLVLGCTHYSLVGGAIRKILGDSVALIGSGEAAADALQVELEECGLAADGTGSDARFYTSGSAGSFIETAGKITGRDISGKTKSVSPFHL